jgi:hypothetical protein
MKKLAVLSALILILGTFATPVGAEEAASKPSPPTFSLTPQEFDGPKRLHFKATLRLWKHAQVTAKALQTCGDTSGAEQALEGFQARNGNTLRMLRNIITKYGGLSPEIKALVDREVAAGTKSLLREVDCLTLTDQVLKNGRDLYKAPELAEDYALVRSQP